MDAVGPCRASDVCTIVYQHLRVRVLNKFCTLFSEFVQNPCAEVFLAKLEKIDFGCDSGFDQVQDLCKVLTRWI